MKLFPERKYNVQIEDEIFDSITELKRNTKLSNSLVSERTKKAFIGQVGDSHFKIISSEIGRGAFCVLQGRFEEKKGVIEIKIHKAFRVMLSIIMIFPFIGFGIAIFQQGFVKSLGIIPALLFLLIFLRFVFIGLTFRFVTQTGLSKLKKILKIKQINLIQH